MAKAWRRAQRCTYQERIKWCRWHSVSHCLAEVRAEACACLFELLPMLCEEPARKRARARSVKQGPFIGKLKTGLGDRNAWSLNSEASLRCRAKDHRSCFTAISEAP
eukprot:6199429-Pleurochrysis_carterae.AAC.6